MASSEGSKWITTSFLGSTTEASGRDERWFGGDAGQVHGALQRQEKSGRSPRGGGGGGLDSDEVASKDYGMGGRGLSASGGIIASAVNWW